MNIELHPVLSMLILRTIKKKITNIEAEIGEMLGKYRSSLVLKKKSAHSTKTNFL